MSDALTTKLEWMRETIDANMLDYYTVSSSVGNRGNDDSSLAQSLYDEA